MDNIGKDWKILRIKTECLGLLSRDWLLRIYAAIWGITVYSEPSPWFIPLRKKVPGYLHQARTNEAVIQVTMPETRLELVRPFPVKGF